MFSRVYAPSMSTKRWDHPPGTCRAIAKVYGPQVVVCHRCKRYIAMPPLDVPFAPCPFRCATCGECGVIKDAAEALDGYRHET